MTTDLQAEILLTALRQWPGRWRHAATALALAEGRDPPSPADLSRAFLTDLSRLDTSVTACRRLIGLGEFETVTQLLAEESLDSADRAALTAERDQATARRVADVRYRLASLQRRSELAGRPIALNPALLEEQAARSYPPVADALAEAERRAAEAEKDARRELWAMATAAAAASPNDATTWLANVRSSLTVGDLVGAQRLLAEGPREPDLHLRKGDPLSGLDEQGTNLATALRALEDQITQNTVLDFVRALCELTGTVAPSYEVHDASGAVLVSVRSHWKELPRWLALPNDEGLTLWVAPGDRPPSAKYPLAWIVVPGESVSGRLDPRSFARLTGDQLLHLALTETSPNARLRGLLKLVCSQLNVADVLDPHSHPLPTAEITDLLGLLGLPANSALAATLRYETGGRPRLIIELLTEIIAGPNGRTEISPVMLQQTRDAWWPRAFEALLGPYRGDHAELLLLVAVEFHADQPDGFTLGDLRKGIAAVALDEEAVPQLLSSPGLPAAAERLVRDGFFQHRGKGVYTLCDDGVRHLLPLGPDGAGVRRHAEAAAVAACRRHLAETAELRAEIADLVVRMMSHMLSGTMSAIKTEMTLIERAQGEELLASLARVRQYTEPGQTLEEQFQVAMRPPEPCALHPLLDAMRGNQSWRSHGIVHVHLDCPPDMYVMANKWLLSQAFANILDNARLAIQDTAVDFGTIRVLVTGDDSSCTIDISDSGCGLTDEIRSELETRRPVPSTRGRGVGLLHSRRWFERYGGNLEIKSWNSDLGGAWFRVELPRCDAPPG